MHAHTHLYTRSRYYSTEHITCTVRLRDIGLNALDFGAFIDLDQLEQNTISRNIVYRRQVEHNWARIEYTQCIIMYYLLYSSRRHGRL